MTAKRVVKVKMTALDSVDVLIAYANVQDNSNLKLDSHK